MAKKVPQRMCVACREMKGKRELIRVVRGPEGCLTADTTGKSPGRGAYICREEACFTKAKKSRAIERALDVKVEDELWRQLQEVLQAAAGLPPQQP